MEAARAALPQDLGELTRLQDAQHEEAATDARGGHMWLLHEARPVGSLGGAINNSEEHVVVGTVDDVPVGFGVARLETLADGRTLAVVSDLFVEPAARGVGVGEAVMEQLLAWARENGAVGVDAFALPGDRHTKNFYESHGLVARSIVVHRRL